MVYVAGVTAVQNRAISLAMGIVLPGIAYICPLREALQQQPLSKSGFEKQNVKLVQLILRKVFFAFAEVSLCILNCCGLFKQLLV